MNEGANGAISECFSYIEQSHSELPCSLSCGTAFYYSVDVLRKNCTSRLLGVWIRTGISGVFTCH